MQTIQHKTHGKGEVISKEVKGNDIYIMVRFDSGKEMQLASDSFKFGVVTAEGDLKDEIDAVIAAKKAEIEASKDAVRVTSVAASVHSSSRRGRTPTRKVTVKGSLQDQYELYLEAAGYPVVGRTGKDSTVPAYAYAVEQVLKEENLTWAELKKNIAQIVTKYDVGGACEDFGAKSNRTVINALKRFAEFVESTESIVKVGE